MEQRAAFCAGCPPTQPRPFASGGVGPGSAGNRAAASRGRQGSRARGTSEAVDMSAQVPASPSVVRCAARRATDPRRHSAAGDRARCIGQPSGACAALRDAREARLREKRAPQARADARETPVRDQGVERRHPARPDRRCRDRARRARPPAPLESRRSRRLTTTERSRLRCFKPPPVAVDQQRQDGRRVGSAGAERPEKCGISRRLVTCGLAADDAWVMAERDIVHHRGEAVEGVAACRRAPAPGSALGSLVGKARGLAARTWRSKLLASGGSCAWNRSGAAGRSIRRSEVQSDPGAGPADGSYLYSFTSVAGAILAFAITPSVIRARPRHQQRRADPILQGARRRRAHLRPFRRCLVDATGGRLEPSANRLLGRWVSCASGGSRRWRSRPSWRVSAPPIRSSR